jgi:hypothetical protein
MNDSMNPRMNDMHASRMNVYIYIFITKSSINNLKRYCIHKHFNMVVFIQNLKWTPKGIKSHGFYCSMQHFGFSFSKH